MRTGKNGIGIIIGFIMGIVILVFYQQIAGMIVGNVGTDLDALHSCDQGLIGSLAGEDSEGLCFDSSRCEVSYDGKSRSTQNMIPDGEDAEAGTSNALAQGVPVLDDLTKRDYYWQNLGQGWGCPPKEAPGFEWCCIKVAKNLNPHSINDIAAANCQGYLGSGKIIIFRDGEGRDACKEPDTTDLSKVGENEQVSIRYYFTEQDTGACEGVVRVEYPGGKTTDVKAFTNCLAGSTPYHTDPVPSPTELLNRESVDLAKLNTGAKLVVTVKAATTVTQSFDIKSKGICPASGVCSGKQVGPVSNGGFCVMNEQSGVCDYAKPILCKKTVDTAGKEISSHVCRNVRFDGPNSCLLMDSGFTYWECIIDAEGTCTGVLFGGKNDPKVQQALSGKYKDNLCKTK